MATSGARRVVPEPVKGASEPQQAHIGEPSLSGEDTLQEKAGHKFAVAEGALSSAGNLCRRISVDLKTSNMLDYKKACKSLIRKFGVPDGAKPQLEARLGGERPTGEGPAPAKGSLLDKVGAQKEAPKPGSVLGQVIRRLELMHCLSQGDDSDDGSSEPSPGEGAAGEGMEPAADEPAGRKRRRAESPGAAGNPDDCYDYSDSFIDDGEMVEMFEAEAKKPKLKGFFINRGDIDRTEENCNGATSAARKSGPVPANKKKKKPSAAVQQAASAKAEPEDGAGPSAEDATGGEPQMPDSVLKLLTKLQTTAEAQKAPDQATINERNQAGKPRRLPLAIENIIKDLGCSFFRDAKEVQHRILEMMSGHLEKFGLENPKETLRNKMEQQVAKIQAQLRKAKNKLKERVSSMLEQQGLAARAAPVTGAAADAQPPDNTEDSEFQAPPSSAAPRFEWDEELESLLHEVVRYDFLLYGRSMQKNHVYKELAKCWRPYPMTVKELKDRNKAAQERQQKKTPKKKPQAKEGSGTPGPKPVPSATPPAANGDGAMRTGEAEQPPADALPEAESQPQPPKENLQETGQARLACAAKPAEGPAAAAGATAPGEDPQMSRERFIKIALEQGADPEQLERDFPQDIATTKKGEGNARTLITMALCHAGGEGLTVKEIVAKVNALGLAVWEEKKKNYLSSGLMKEERFLRMEKFKYILRAFASVTKLKPAPPPVPKAVAAEGSASLPPPQHQPDSLQPQPVEMVADASPSRPIGEPDQAPPLQLTPQEICEQPSDLRVPGQNSSRPLPVFASIVPGKLSGEGGSPVVRSDSEEIDVIHARRLKWRVNFHALKKNYLSSGLMKVHFLWGPSVFSWSDATPEKSDPGGMALRLPGMNLCSSSKLAPSVRSILIKQTPPLGEGHMIFAG
eukprot:CAMPEP_0177590694 /NCGR_PEP_ID=MMETSP0419_2-20121207/7561_1 /TAXON_ID=582737 /ORGANISM="Tetraselmis sp., Strain GSL018" /LENGTH=910 /DNA_ID=CAMNT_0019081307 /DNA_START=421 /DNA_END=3155 /DNA_ORIENTATION=+